MPRQERGILFSGEVLKALFSATKTGIKTL
jgi:hypothetical protein